MSVNIKVLKALYGDCIILTYGLEQDKYILIDGGIGKQCYRSLKVFIDSLKENNSNLSLLILTHIDSDHIDGILKLFSEENFDFSKINKMWFNYGDFLDKELEAIRYKEKNDILLHDETTKISWRQGTSLEKILKHAGFQYEKVVKVYDEFDIDDAHITLLSPSLEILREFNEHWMIEEERETKISTVSDYEIPIEELNNLEFHENISLANKSSLAFIFEYQQIKALFLGDASATEIEKSLSELGYSETNPLVVDICKISHHASKHNTSNSLIRMLKCKNYIISTNLTASGRPSKECLSRIICNSKEPVDFYCNYEIDFNKIFTKQESEKYGMKFITIDENGINLEDLHR
ncbi:hypothetical protein [Petroclostridium sp. X23]|uniref:ComEC/Rec2 family competence protein n=1 Tax=Petroclostridium sp. X23 TaxID=3045146 RepID=UPI0024ACF47B|nr:hypothetical protein [Petroclostridium sp. X23]WHH58828.1 hypothetical protein QKW49_24055 [Petroclostridium sp. X23]